MKVEVADGTPGRCGGASGTPGHGSCLHELFQHSLDISCMMGEGSHSGPGAPGGGMGKAERMVVGNGLWQRGRGGKQGLRGPVLREQGQVTCCGCESRAEEAPRAWASPQPQAPPPRFQRNCSDVPMLQAFRFREIRTESYGLQ